MELGPTDFQEGGYWGHGQIKGLPFDPDFWYDISSPYGPRAPITLPDGRVSGGFHTGVDIPRSAGTIVFAPAPGVVVTQRTSLTYGNMVVLKHDDGSATKYLHLEAGKLMVGEGMRLRRGDILGFVGTTGFSTGNHLHWEYIPDHDITGVSDPLEQLVSSLSEPEPDLVVPGTFAGFTAETRTLLLLVKNLREFPREYDPALGAVEREVEEMLEAIKAAERGN